MNLLLWPSTVNTVALNLKLCCSVPLFLGYLGFSAAALAEDIVLDRIKAVVNEGVVLQSDLSTATEFYRQQARSNQQTLPPDDVLSERVLDELINQKIREQHARELGVAVDAGSINRAVEQIARNNNMDALQFRQTLDQQGFDYDQFRDNIEQELLLQRLIERDVQTRIRVSAQEIDDFVERMKNDAEEQNRYRIQHILVAVPSSAASAELEVAQTRARAVVARLQAGDDFSEVAAASSDGARALQGGDLGWRTLQEVPEFLATALREMRPGDLSEPLRSANGLHIIRLADVQTGNQTQLSETLARHIFVTGNDSAVQSQLASIRTRIVAGESFKSLAAEVSQDPNSASTGGELPWFSAGQMPPAMEEMANGLTIGQISQPFRTQFGWHLLEVLDRRTRSINDETLRQRALAALRQRKVEQETERWSRQLRDESFVEVRNR